MTRRPAAGNKPLCRTRTNPTRARERCPGGERHRGCCIYAGLRVLLHGGKPRRHMPGDAWQRGRSLQGMGLCQAFHWGRRPRVCGPHSARSTNGDGQENRGLGEGGVELQEQTRVRFIIIAGGGAGESVVAWAFAEARTLFLRWRRTTSVLSPGGTMPRQVCAFSVIALTVGVDMP